MLAPGDILVVEAFAIDMWVKGQKKRAMFWCGTTALVLSTEAGAAIDRDLACVLVEGRVLWCEHDDLMDKWSVIVESRSRHASTHSERTAV